MSATNQRDELIQILTEVYQSVPRHPGMFRDHADAILSAGWRRVGAVDDTEAVERMAWAMWEEDGSPSGVAKRDPYRKLARAAIRALTQDTSQAGDQP